jgi:hypothetical protein
MSNPDLSYRTNPFVHLLGLAGGTLRGTGFTGAAPQAAAHARSNPGLMARLDNWLWAQQQRAQEAWLAQSGDVYELERRMRALERGGARF